MKINKLLRIAMLSVIALGVQSSGQSQTNLINFDDGNWTTPNGYVGISSPNSATFGSGFYVDSVGNVVAGEWVQPILTGNLDTIPGETYAIAYTISFALLDPFDHPSDSVTFGNFTTNVDIPVNYLFYTNMGVISIVGATGTVSLDYSLAATSPTTMMSFTLVIPDDVGNSSLANVSVTAVPEISIPRLFGFLAGVLVLAQARQQKFTCRSWANDCKAISCAHVDRSRVGTVNKYSCVRKFLCWNQINQKGTMKIIELLRIVILSVIALGFQSGGQAQTNLINFDDGNWTVGPNIVPANITVVALGETGTSGNRVNFLSGDGWTSFGVEVDLQPPSLTGSINTIVGTTYEVSYLENYYAYDDGFCRINFGNAGYSNNFPPFWDTTNIDFTFLATSTTTPVSMSANFALDGPGHVALTFTVTAVPEISTPRLFGFLAGVLVLAQVWRRNWKCRCWENSHRPPSHAHADRHPSPLV